MGNPNGGKYGEIQTQHGSFYQGEPVFLIRAQDPFAVDIITQYVRMCEDRGCTVEHIEGVEEFCNEVALWQDQNPALVKQLPGSPPFRDDDNFDPEEG